MQRKANDKKGKGGKEEAAGASKTTAKGTGTGAGGDRKRRGADTQDHDVANQATQA